MFNIQCSDTILAIAIGIAIAIETDPCYRGSAGALPSIDYCIHKQDLPGNLKTEHYLLFTSYSAPRATPSMPSPKNFVPFVPFV